MNDNTEHNITKYIIISVGTICCNKIKKLNDEPTNNKATLGMVNCIRIMFNKIPAIKRMCFETANFNFKGNTADSKKPLKCNTQSGIRN